MPRQAPPTAAPSAPPLPAALAGERFEFDSPAGRLSCYADGPAAAATPPLLLVHTVNAAASAAEVRPVYDHARSTRPVYAPDLPGYGFSERSDRAYTPRLMTDALLATLAQIQARHGDGPVDVLGASLGCEFVARAAVEAPSRLRRLALVSPTGLRGTRRLTGPPGSVIGPPWVHALLRGPGRGPGRGAGWGEPLFRGLTRPGVIRYFLRRTWGSRDIDEALWQYDVLTTRQPGSEYAPLCFLAAALFSADITTLYEGLTQPVWMTHGTRGDFTDYRGAAALSGRPNWRIEVYDGGALPYFEHPQRFNATLDAFLDAP
jgi:pimeloyl-ACP methyl ester carboxylesterase